MFRKSRKYALAAAMIMSLALSGCSLSSKPLSPGSGGESGGAANCSNLAEKRKEAETNYASALRKSEEDWIKERDAAGQELKQCLETAGKNMPCDQEWQAVETAYGLAMGDISNQAAYDIYKQAKKGWDECFKKIDKKNEDKAKQFKEKESGCQSDFQAKIDAGRQRFDENVASANKTRDEALKALAELEKQCREKLATPKPETPQAPEENAAKPTAPKPEKPVVEKTADDPCEPVVPGANARPRTGQAGDFGPQDIIVNLITQVAEDVTGAAIPTSALSDQIFAVAVVAKITTRIAEINLEMMEADSQSRYGRVRLLERKLQKYKDALDVWGKIAQGRPPLNIKEKVARLNEDNSVFCSATIETSGTLEIRRGR